MKILGLLLLVGFANSAFADTRCGTVTAVDSVAKMVMQEKKYNITRPQRTIQMNVELDNSIGYALPGDQVALALQAFDKPEKYELCFESSVFHLEQPGIVDDMALKVSLRKKAGK